MHSRFFRRRSSLTAIAILLAVAVDSAYKPRFSPDGRHMAYVASRGDKWFVVLDGVPGPAGDSVEHCHASFSADGKRTAMC